MKIISWLYLLPVVLVLLPEITIAQACCSLQGHFQSFVIEQYAYNLNYTNAEASSLSLNLRFGNDLYVNALIEAGFSMTVSLDYQFQTAQFLALDCAP